MDSIGDLLGKYAPQAPDEVLTIKQYIAEAFGAPASVGVQGETLVITVGSASLANALRMRTTELQAAAHTTKRLMFRIG